MWHTYCKNILLCRLIRTYWSKKLVSLHGLTHLYWEQKPIVPVSLVKAIGIDRQTRIPIEGVNRYRHEIPQNIDIPIGIFNRLLSSKFVVPAYHMVLFFGICFNTERICQAKISIYSYDRKTWSSNPTTGLYLSHRHSSVDQQILGARFGAWRR